ncbi:MAG: hypothetical protein ABIQ72_20090 [Usitatibacter sp.]
MRARITIIKALLVSAIAALASVHAQAVATNAAWDGIGQPEAVEVVMGGQRPIVLLARRNDADPVRSFDGGLHWTEFTVGGQRPARFMASPVDENLFYALVFPSGRLIEQGFGETPALHRTLDGGATWQMMRAQLEVGGKWLGNLRVSAEPDVLYATRMIPALCSAGCIYEGSGAVRSVDAGRTWTDIDGKENGSGLGFVQVSTSEPDVLFAATRNAVFRSDNRGTRWDQVLTVGTDTVRQVVIDQRDARIVYVRNDEQARAFVTEDAGANWTLRANSPIPGPDRHLLADPAEAGRAYFLGGEGAIFESRDRARTWSQVGIADPEGPLQGPWEYQDRNTPGVGMAAGKRVLLRATVFGGGIRRSEVAPDALALGSDLWWNPSESGMGWSITQHASGRVFVVWYGYGESGAPLWRVMPDAVWTDGRTLSGAMYITTGPDYFKTPFDPLKVTVQSSGNAMLRFDDSNAATFSYVLAGGVAGSKRITRQLYGTQETTSWRPGNYADLWWNSAESGWGLAFNQQFSTAFATWYVYDEAGKPLWIVMPEGRLGWETIGNIGAWNFFGDIYTTHGPNSGEPFDPAKVVVTRVGAASIAFETRDKAWLTYEAFGRNERRALTRQPF